MEETGSASFDIGLDADPALREIKRIREALKGLTGDIFHTSKILERQIKTAVSPFDELLKGIQGNSFGDRNARLGLQSRRYTAGERATRSYILYGGDPQEGGEAQARQSRFVAFQAELNKNRQEINRLTSALAKDLIQGAIDSIRTEVRVAEARIREEFYQAEALIRRTTSPALIARATLDQERIDRQIDAASPQSVAFRNRRYTVRRSRENDVELQDAVAARQAVNDAKLKYRYSPEGQTAAAEEARVKAEERTARKERSEAARLEREVAKARAERARKEREELRNSPEALATARYRRDLGMVRNTPEARAARLRNARRSTEDEITRSEIGNVAFGNRRTQERVSDASFLGVQASLMGNYAAIAGVYNSIRYLFSFVVELDKEFKQFQAISEATETEMASLELQFIKVAQASKFTAVEIAKAATTMAQAGLSANEVSKSIGAVVNLATASGSTLQESVDLVTSVIGAFNLQGSETAKIADVVTEALNRTKLTVDKLALGIQYSGNIAADAGISYTELTAILGALAQTGIRSGSTLGTGLRQLLIDLKKPTEGFKETLDRLGLSLQDVDVTSNGFLGVLSKLKSAGFTAADAIGSFEVRAAASYTALANNISTIAELNTSFATTTASAKASEVQMESLSNTWINFVSTFAGNAKVAFTPTIGLLQDVINVGGDALGLLTQYPAALSAIGSTFALITAAVSVGFFAKLAAGAWMFVSGLTGVTAGMNALRIATLGHPILGLATLVATIAGAFYLATGKADDFGDTMEKIATASNAVRGQIDGTEQSLKSVNAQIKTLNQQSATLDRDPILRRAKIVEVQGQFSSLGLEIDANSSSIGQLINKLEDLSQALSGKLVTQYAEELAVMRREAGLLDDQISKAREKNKIRDGLSDIPQDRAAGAFFMGRARGRGVTPDGLTLEQAVQQAGAYIGDRSVNPQSATDFVGLVNRINRATTDRETEADRLRFAPRLSGSDAERLRSLEAQIKSADTFLKQIVEMGDLLTKRDVNEQNQRRIRDQEAAKAFENSSAGRQIMEAREKLYGFTTSAPRRFAQATNNETEFQRLRDEQDAILRDQRKAIETGRAFLKDQGRSADEIAKIMSDSETLSAEAKAGVDKAMKEIAEGPVKLLKKQAEETARQIQELGSSVNINSSLQRIEGAIQSMTGKVADQFNVTARSIPGFDYTADSDKGEIIRRAVALARSRGVDPAEILATIQKESGFRRNAQPIDRRTGRKLSDAYGLFQFIPSTGQRFGFTPGVDLDTELSAGITHAQSVSKILTSATGSKTSPFENYLGHLLGPGGALRAIRGDKSSNAIEELGVLARNNGAKSDQTLGEFLQFHKSKYEKIYAGALDVLEKIEPSLKQLDETVKLRTKAEQKRTSSVLKAEAKADLEGLDVLVSEAKAANDSKAIDALLGKARGLVPSILDKQIRALKESPEFSDRLSDAEPDAIREIKEREEALQQELEAKIRKIIDAKYDAALKALKVPVDQAKARLENLQSGINRDNVGSAELKDAQLAVESAERTQALEAEKVAKEKVLELEKALKAARDAQNLPAVTAETERLADAENSLAQAKEKSAITNTRQSPMTFGQATDNGTYNFLNSAGLIRSDGSIQSGAEAWGESWSQVLSGVSSQFSEFSWSVAKAPKKWEEAAKSWGSSFVNMLGEMISKALSLQLIMGLFGDGGGKNQGLLGSLLGGSGGGLETLFSATPMAGGGEVRGGIPNRDSRLIKGLPGEFMLRKAAVDVIGKDNLHAINSMGGHVKQMDKPAAFEVPQPKDGGTVNVYAVLPEEKPQMGPNDIVAVITDDIRRKGATKQLIKAVQMGNV